MNAVRLALLGGYENPKAGMLWCGRAQKRLFAVPMALPSAARAELASLSRRFRVKPVAYHFVEVKRQRLSDDHAGHSGGGASEGLHKTTGVCTGCGALL